MSIDLYLLECFMSIDTLEDCLTKISSCIQNGEVLTREMIGYYRYLDKENKVLPRLLLFLEEQQNNSQEDIDCKHVWSPAGHKKNKDRIHNKGNGKGKYQAYKCEECGKFKRRYIK